MKYVLIVYFIIISINLSNQEIDINYKLKFYNNLLFKYIPNFNAKLNSNSIASVNFNPGNLKYNNKFAKFNSIEEGFNALINDIKIKQNGKSSYLSDSATIDEFINIYAPSFENNTNNYLLMVINELNINNFTKIKDINCYHLAKIIIKIEDIDLYNNIYSY
jgi:hypothetical protein